MGKFTTPVLTYPHKGMVKKLTESCLLRELEVHGFHTPTLVLDDSMQVAAVG